MWWQLLIMAAVACVSGIIQGVTGFGACIVMMLVFPHFFAVPQAAGIAISGALVLCLIMTVRFRREVRLKKVIPPAVFYIAVCTAAIWFGSKLDAALIKRVLGGFLIALAVYYLFFQKKSEGKPLSLPASAGALGFSAVCDGLFGIGGPLLAVYYLGITRTAHEFLGMIQCFFLVTCLWNTGFRFATGVLGTAHLSAMACTMAGIAAGAFIAIRIVDKVNAEVLKKLTYVMIGVSGVINLIG